MIDPGLRKLAEENHMCFTPKYAYGSLRDYNVVFSETNRNITIMIWGCWSDNSQKAALHEYIEKIDTGNLYYIKKIELLDDGVNTVFYRKKGIFEKICQFLDFLMPLLPVHGLLDGRYCSACGQLLGKDEKWRIIEDYPMIMHETCIQQMEMEVAEDLRIPYETSIDEEVNKEEFKNTNKKNYMTILLALFHRDGWIWTTLLIAWFTKSIYVIGINAILYAIWNLIGYRMKWKHIYCSSQSSHHKKMTPDRINWNEIKTSEIYGISGCFFLIGIMLLVVLISG